MEDAESHPRYGRWVGLNRPSYDELTPQEKIEYRELEKMFGTPKAPKFEQALQKAERKSSLTDEQLKQKYGYKRGIAEKLVMKFDKVGQKIGLVDAPEDEWLKNKRIEEEAQEVFDEEYAKELAEQKKEVARLAAIEKVGLSDKQSKLEEAELKRKLKYQEKEMQLKAKYARRRNNGGSVFGGLGGFRWAPPQSGLNFSWLAKSNERIVVPKQTNKTKWATPEATLSKMWKPPESQVGRGWKMPESKFLMPKAQVTKPVKKKKSKKKRRYR